MKLLKTSLIVVLWSCIVANANVIQNGDFESWTASEPDSWQLNGGVTTTQVTGLDGTGSALQVSSAGSLTQDFTPGSAGTIFFQFNCIVINHQLCW